MEMDQGTFSPTYFALEDIIASQIRVPCKTEIDLPNFGFLEPSLNSENLPTGVELELPLWVAQVMGKPGRRYLTVNLPKKYKEAHSRLDQWLQFLQVDYDEAKLCKILLRKCLREGLEVPHPYFLSQARAVLKADATVVDLNKMGPQFYQSGLHLATLPHTETDQIAEILPEVLQRRLQSMSDSYSFSAVVHTADEAGAAPKGTLMKEATMDSLEHRLFNDGRKGAEAMQDWLENRITSK